MGRRTFVLLLLLVILMSLLACAGSTQPTAAPLDLALATSPTPTVIPTPNISQTVTAAIKATAEAVPTATSPPISTVQPTQDLSATIAAAVQTAIAALPSESPTTSPSPTASPTPTPMPLPSPTPHALRIEIPTATPIASENLVSMIKRVRAGVVRIENGGGTGSGIIFEKNADSGAAFILTNNHVVEVIRQGQPNIDVTVNDSTKYRAILIGVDVEKDLAVLQICCGKFTVLDFGDAETLQVGSDVIAMGYSLGLTGPATTTRGIVSGFREQTGSNRRLIQTDAPINPGNSGGPIFTLSGEVLGLNTFKLAGVLFEGLGFAVSEETLQEQLPRLMLGGDALDSEYVAAEWSYGPEPGKTLHNVGISSYPWMLEWTLEEGGTLLNISSAGKTWVDTTTAGTGTIPVLEYGQTAFNIISDGRYTITAKTFSTAVNSTNIKRHWTYGPKPSNAHHEFVITISPWVLEWTLEEKGTLLRIVSSSIGVETNTPGTGRIVNFKPGKIALDISSEGRYTLVVKTVQASVDNPLNVAAEWTNDFGSGPTEHIKIDSVPWMLEWTVEEARTPIVISIAEIFADGKIYKSDWSTVVLADQPGLGSVEFWDIGEFAFQFEGDGQFSVVVKTK